MAGRATNEAANYFAIGKQSAKDTEATTFIFLRHLDGTGLEMDTQVQAEREGGDGQEVGLVYKSAIAMDGAAVANARAEYAARVIGYALGAVTAAAVPAGSAGASVCQIQTAAPTSLGASAAYLTLEQMFGDKIERVSNAQVSEVTIEGEAGRPIKVSANFVGGGTPYARNAAASALTPTRETGQPLFFPGASVVIDGAGNTKITKFKQTIRRTLDEDIRTTQLFREDVVALNFDSDLEFTLKYEDATLYDKIQMGGGTVVPIDLATGSFDFFTAQGAGTSYRFLRTAVPVHRYTGARVNKLDPDGKTVYIDVTAMGVKGATHQVFAQIQTASQAAL
jgi:hypothetical protein